VATGSGSGILWLRRDLRIRDHPALRAALDRHHRVVPVFCLDERLLHGRHASGPRTRFLLDCLGDLDRELRSRGSGLVIVRGRPERELPVLAEELGAGAVHFTHDLSPFARDRDERVGRTLADAGFELCPHPGLSAVDDVAALRTREGKPYTIFSPFHRAWLEADRREVLTAPRRLPPLPSKVTKGRLPSLASLGLSQEVRDSARGGESEARRVADRFLRGSVRDYADARDRLGREGTSRLSPYLHFGCITPRQLERRLPPGKGPDAFRRQLCWRDFHHHVLVHFPRNVRSEFQTRYRGRISWSRSSKALEAWQEGRTGYPLVDAGMRQLLREGWMHNRARLVAGSFLTKDLGIDWRRGERWFMRMLIDGDEANNNGNWQWIASVGTDPHPAFRRTLSPTRQMERFDPDGVYVRRHVPELRRVPDEFLREPWTMPDEVQRRSRCLIGADYPEPIVDHAVARREALDRFRLGGAAQPD
jgi:deoxyribodipyrimidine photo-lyase